MASQVQIPFEGVILKPMASQVQIPFESVILQEHSAPISCPTPNFAKGSEVNEILGAETMRTHCNS